MSRKYPFCSTELQLKYLSSVKNNLAGSPLSSSRASGVSITLILGFFAIKFLLGQCPPMGMGLKPSICFC